MGGMESSTQPAKAGTAVPPEWMRAAGKAIIPISVGTVKMGDGGIFTISTVGHCLIHSLVDEYFLAHPLSDHHFPNHPEKAVESCSLQARLAHEEAEFERGYAACPRSPNDK